MSEEKIKVKDLATELGVSAKDVIAKAKELGILSVKVSASSITGQEAVRLRERFAPSSDKPEVIVRRRSGKRDESVQSVVSSAEAERAQQDHESEPDSKLPPLPSTQISAAARIISRPSETAQEAVAGGSEDAPSAQSQPGVPTEVAASNASAEGSAQETDSHPLSEEQEEIHSSSVQELTDDSDQMEVGDNRRVARVVRPAAFSAEPDRNAAGEAISSAPAQLSSKEKEQEELQSAPTKEPESAVSQVRVISRPDSQPRGQRPEKQQEAGAARPGAGRPGTAARPGAPRPGAPRPGAARPGTARSGQPGGYPASRTQQAPGSVASPAGTSGFPPSEGGDSEQGRKKRQKGKRTVDFGAENKLRQTEDQGWSKSTGRRMKKSGKTRDSGQLGGTQPIKAVKRVIKVEEFIRVSDLAHQMGLKASEIIKILFNLGIMATINQSLDVDTATLVAGEFGYEVERSGFFEEEVLTAQQEEDKPEDLRPRPPVVTIMGHVDHGKTSLLDALRKSSVVTGEAGGITQHIGAYHVTTKRGEIVFLDTPGHEAFTAMRARGAEVTDIVVLVVAADDGVMEQTREAVSHARAAKVPIMVAVNKMDKPEANPERVKRELSELGLVSEDWGGDTTFTYVSAKTRQGLDELLELLALQAEILELKANPNKAATGYIVEAKLDKGRGSLGTVLIQDGTLRLGDPFVCGIHSGRVRAMFDDQGRKVKEAGPSMPVEVQGFEGVPEAGEQFISIADERTARRIAEARALKQRERELAKESKVTLETFLARKRDDVETIILNLVVKADVQGSLEAITEALQKLSTEQVAINVMHGGAGAISESDVLLASASNAIIIGFNVRPTAKAKELAEAEKVDMRFYDIIYKLVEEIKSAMEGMLAPVAKEVFLGTAEVRELFSVPKVGVVAGCHVTDGKIIRNCHARLLRDGVVIYTGKLASLRRFKDDVKEVAKGYECGIGLEHYNDIKVGDLIEGYEIVEEAAKLE